MKARIRTATVKRRRRLALAFAIGLSAPLALGMTNARADEEWEEYTLLYEDDAWYDVSEWFDGNDDDWFYDYYDYGYSDYYDYDYDDDFEFVSDYYDYDNDGIYDAYASYADTDGDGLYDEWDYISFSDPSAAKDQASKQQAQQSARQSKAQAERKQKSQPSKMTQFEGQVKQVKKVETPAAKNVVVHLQNSSINKSMAVDLGPAKDLQRTPQQGDRLMAKGVALKAGEKQVLLTQKLERDGQQHKIDRSGRQYSGTIETMMTAKVRGQQHQLAKINTDEGKKLLVDLGATDKLDSGQIKQGATVKVRGPAVKVNDRMMLIAKSVKVGNQEIEIKRVALKS